jgi:hypothetical protein
VVAVLEAANHDVTAAGHPGMCLKLLILVLRYANPKFGRIRVLDQKELGGQCPREAGRFWYKVTGDPDRPGNLLGGEASRRCKSRRPSG